jgi:hypothetical protein
LVGGLAIFVALLAAAAVAGIATSAGYFLFALSIVIAVGMWDDVTDISPRVKFAIQIVASCLMIFGAGVELTRVGDLLGWRPIGLWIFAIPAHGVRRVGVVNSLNMMDGLDGLGGSIALIAFVWYCGCGGPLRPRHPVPRGAHLLRRDRGLPPLQPAFPVATAGARLPGRCRQPHDRLSRSGGSRSTSRRAMAAPCRPSPRCGCIVLPLADCVSLMTRRRARAQEPVPRRQPPHPSLLVGAWLHARPDAGDPRGHHDSLRRGSGFFGWQLNVPERSSSGRSSSGSSPIHWWIQRAWIAIDAKRATLRRRDRKSSRPPSDAFHPVRLHGQYLPVADGRGRLSASSSPIAGLEKAFKVGFRGPRTTISSGKAALRGRVPRRRTQGL